MCRGSEEAATGMKTAIVDSNYAEMSAALNRAVEPIRILKEAQRDLGG
jgi:hypothetical protein